MLLGVKALVTHNRNIKHLILTNCSKLDGSIFPAIAESLGTSIVSGDCCGFYKCRYCKGAVMPLSILKLAMLQINCYFFTFCSKSMLCLKK